MTPNNPIKIVLSNDTDLILGDVVREPIFSDESARTLLYHGVVDITNDCVTLAPRLHIPHFKTHCSELIANLKLYISLCNELPIITLPKVYKTYLSAFRNKLPLVEIRFSDGYTPGDYNAELEWYESLSDDNRDIVIRLMDAEINMNKIMEVINDQQKTNIPA